MNESRRRALMGAAGVDNPEYISSNGRTYRKYMTIHFNATGQTIPGVLNWYGLMTEMEELTITGGLKGVNVTAMINGRFDWSLYAPNLKKLLILPTKCFKSGGDEITYFNFSHYAFSELRNLEYLQLGGLQEDGYVKFNSGGYFRQDINGSSNVSTVGTDAGLELVVYRTAYHSQGGFANGTKAESTTIIQYDWATGEVLTA